MKGKFIIVMSTLFVAIGGEYVGPQNGFHRNGNGNGHGNGNGNGNGNSYGVPPDSFTPPQEQGGPYPPSGWKPAGRRLLLPGESRSADQPLDSGFGHPPPSQYGPAQPARPPPPQYGPSVDHTAPPNNQYIPGTGFGNGNGGNGNGNGNGHNGNGHNGNGHSGNGHNGNGHNGNGHNGNGHNGNGFNGNGQNGHNGNGGNGNGNGNGHNGNGHNGNGNGNGNGHHNGNGNGFSNGVAPTGNGNGFSNGNGPTGNGNGFSNGNGFANGNGFSNGGNGKVGSGTNGAPSFHGSFPTQGVVYPFVQLSVPATIAAVGGAGPGASPGIFPVFQVPHGQAGPGLVAPSFSAGAGAGSGVFPAAAAFPSVHASAGAPDLSGLYPGIQVTGTQDVARTYPTVFTQGNGLAGNGFAGNGFGQYYTLLTNGHSHKSGLLGLRTGLNLQVQNAIGQHAYGTGGVPLGVF